MCCVTVAPFIVMCIVVYRNMEDVETHFEGFAKSVIRQ